MSFIPKEENVGKHTEKLIGFCLIVKDEEKNIRRCLDSIKSFADEIIIVDTGSSDNTVEICKEYTDKIYYHEWENDFSLHRNQSISYCDCDWIFIIDADEELDKKSGKMIKNMLKNTPDEVAAILIELYNDVSVGGKTFILHPRIFRKTKYFRYEGIVHNKPVIVGEIRRAPIKLYHYGYNTDPEIMKKKYERRISMIKKWCEQEPENYRPYSYLAHAYLSDNNQLHKCVINAFTALTLLHKTGGNVKQYPHVYYPLIAGLLGLGRDKEVLQFADNCRDICPEYPDPLYYVSAVYLKHGKWEKCIESSIEFLRLQKQCEDHPEKFILFENMTLTQKYRIFYHIAISYCKLKQYDEVIKIYPNIHGGQASEELCGILVNEIIKQKEYKIAKKLIGISQKQFKCNWKWLKDFERQLNLNFRRTN